ncbi:MAG TPA: C39 family peptidase [Candidatus Tetragenococcus pullicola]|nr:C39 family peptidase [Candidatus Tetragenococcus pullicola]
MITKKDRWIGISEDRFKNYQNWTTPSGYLCGTHAATVLLAYYQDFIDESLIPNYIRKKNSRQYQTLSHFLQAFIQPYDFPTTSFQVSHGLSKYFCLTKKPLRARMTMVGGWQRAVKRIDEGKPVIVGVLKILGSTYGNHWVTAYAYMETSNGQRYLKVHDNWGNYNKIIPAKWINGTVSLP